jgi:hypothetical protein
VGASIKAQSEALDEWRRAVLETNGITVKDEFQDVGFLAAVGSESRGKKVDVIRELMKGIEPVPFRIRFETEYESEDEWTHPHRKVDFGDEWSEIMEKAEYCNFPGHFLAVKNTVAVTLAVVASEDRSSNPFLQRLAFYLKNVEGSGTGRTVRGKPVLSESDTMMQVRIVITCIFAVEYEMSVVERGLPVGTILLETHQYFFDDPFYNTNQFKGMFNIFKKSWFAGSTTGTRVVWGEGKITNQARPKLGIPREVNIIDNDMIYLELPKIKQALLDEETKLTENGMPALAKMARSLLTADPTSKAYRIVQVLNSLVSLTGFTRALPALAHKHTFEGAAEIPEVPNPPYAPFLEKAYNEFMTWWIEDRKPLDEVNFLRNIPNILTSRSAGGRGVAKKARVEIPLPPSLHHAGNDKMVMDLTDKRGVFMVAPSYGLDVDGVKRGYTEENPGRLGSRQVTSGRGTRGIFLRDLSSFVSESDFALSLMDYMMDKGTTRAGDERRWQSFFTPIAFTIGAESGNVFADHVELFIGCSDPDIMVEADDYSEFDTTQKYENMRKFIRKVMGDRFRAAGYTTPFLDWKGGLAEMIETIHGKGSVADAHFKTKTGQWEYVIKVDQVSSGEFATLAVNNMTNRAIVSHFLDVFRGSELARDFNFTGCRIQGDDFIGLIKVSNLTVSKLERLLEMRAETAKANGYSLNVIKSTARRFAGEYLKKEVLLGRTMELRHVQWATSERDPGRVDVTNQLRAYGSTMTTLVARGFSSKIAYRILMYTCALRMNLRGRSDGKIESFYPHPAAFWGPAVAGGLGIYPSALLGASVDSPIAIYLAEHPDEEEVVARALHGLQWVRTRRLNTMTEAALNSGVFDNGIEFMKQRQLDLRKMKSVQALDSLRRVGAPPMGNLQYMNHHIGYLETVMTSQRAVNRHLFAMDQDDQLRNALRQIEKKPDLNVVRKHFEWVFGLKISRAETLIRKPGICPSPCLDEHMRNLAREFGISSTPALTALNPQVFTSRLKIGDRNAPRHLTPEAIFSYVSRPVIAISSENVANAFIAMGFDESNSVKVANEMAAFTKEYTFQRAASTYSYGDGFLQRLDRTADVVSNRSDVSGFSSDSNLNVLLNEQFLLYSILETERTGLDYKITAFPSDARSWNMVRRNFLGHRFAPLAESHVGLWDRLEQ